MTQNAIEIKKQLMDRISKFHNDPYGFVMFAYPWGEKGTPLADENGPDPWQEKILKDISHGLQNGWIENEGQKIDCSTGIYIAVRSGHGIGKTTLMTWLDHWFSSTHPNPQCITTANTKEQLTSKTWREMSKWHKLLINQHWFKWTATRFICLSEPSTWFSSAIPWSVHNPEAFAGAHEKYVMVKFDEGSTIIDAIWETTEGAMTDSKGIKIWIVFGNPTRNTGRFTECFKKFRHRWVTYEIDSRLSSRTDKNKIAQWIEDYGEDSDFVRVRVKGQEPRAGVMQFIPNDIVEAAKDRVVHISDYINRPKILAVDIARFGDDQTVLIKRQGTAAYGLKKYRNLSTQQVAGIIAQEIQNYEPDATFLDMGSTGAAVFEILIGWGYDVTGVWFSAAADDQKIYFNKRVEMWGKLRDWIRDGGCIPDDNELRDDLIGPEYGFSSTEQFQLEKKEDMKSRGIASPDCGDALALTFAYPVASKSDGFSHKRKSGSTVKDYDLFTGKPKAQRERTKKDYDIFGVTDDSCTRQAA
jgi:hypothetical protein